MLACIACVMALVSENSSLRVGFCKSVSIHVSMQEPKVQLILF